MARQHGGEDVLYVATAQALDEEMRVRIAAHQAERPAGWRTLEAPSLLNLHLPGLIAGARVVLVDCLTLLVNNAMMTVGAEATAEEAEAQVEKEVSALMNDCARSSATWIVVSNEVGMGLVPAYLSGRVYRDILGRVNQQIAAEADQVLLLVAGIPLRIK